MPYPLCPSTPLPTPFICILPTSTLRTRNISHAPTYYDQNIRNSQFPNQINNSGIITPTTPARIPMIVSLPRAIFVSGGVCYGDCRRRKRRGVGRYRGEQQGIGDKTLQVQYSSMRELLAPVSDRNGGGRWRTETLCARVPLCTV